MQNEPNYNIKKINLNHYPITNYENLHNLAEVKTNPNEPILFAELFRLPRYLTPAVVAATNFRQPKNPFIRPMSSRPPLIWGLAAFAASQNDTKHSRDARGKVGTSFVDVIFLHGGCCGGSDLTGDGNAGLDDLEILCSNWQEGV